MAYGALLLLVWYGSAAVTTLVLNIQNAFNERKLRAKLAQVQLEGKLALTRVQLEGKVALTRAQLEGKVEQAQLRVEGVSTQAQLQYQLALARLESKLARDCLGMHLIKKYDGLRTLLLTQVAKPSSVRLVLFRTEEGLARHSRLAAGVWQHVNLLSQNPGILKLPNFVAGGQPATHWQRSKVKEPSWRRATNMCFGGIRK